MAKAAKDGSRVVADNRKARFNYEILDTYEAGIALTGTEVKSLRQGKATIGDAYAGPSGEEFFLFNAYIPEYLQANRFNHETKRPRRLLLHQAPDRQADRRDAARGHHRRSAEDLFQRARPGEGRARRSGAARSCTTSARPRSSATGTASARG